MSRTCLACQNLQALVYPGAVSRERRAGRFCVSIVLMPLQLAADAGCCARYRAGARRDRLLLAQVNACFTRVARRLSNERERSMAGGHL